MYPESRDLGAYTLPGKTQINNPNVKIYIQILKYYEEWMVTPRAQTCIVYHQGATTAEIGSKLGRDLPLPMVVTLVHART